MSFLGAMGLAYVGGIIAGGIVARIFMVGFFSRGTLIIDKTNSEKDVYRFDISDLDAIESKKRISINVKTIESQE